MKRWKANILAVDFCGKNLNASQIKDKIMTKGVGYCVPNTRQIGYFCSNHKDFEIVGEVRIYRRINNEISKNSMGGGL